MSISHRILIISKEAKGKAREFKYWAISRSAGSEFYLRIESIYGPLTHSWSGSWLRTDIVCRGEWETVSGYVCNHGSPSGERDTASPRGHYGERLQRDSCLKKHMKKHHPLAGDSPWRHYRRDHNIRTAGRIHHPLLRLKLASEAWPQSLGDAVSRSPLGEPWLHT